jgi:hypothetical protein
VLQRMLNPRLPQICNTDGDELAITTVRYPLKAEVNADAVRRALAAIPAMRAESKTFWNWIGSQKRSGTRRAGDHTFITTTLDDGSLVLGTLELKDDMLVLEANSHQRAERGRALIEPAIGELVGEPLIEAKTAAELMTSRAAKPPSSGLLPDEERAVIHANLDRHYVNLLDQRVPALGNVTPRRAAKTEKGRQKLVAWLKYLENGAARHEACSPMAEYDLRWMWDELGVADLRR